MYNRNPARNSDRLLKTEYSVFDEKKPRRAFFAGAD